MIPHRHIFSLTPQYLL